MTRSIAVLALAVSSAAWAQIDAPRLGYLPEGGHLRPVYGIPSAATVSAPLDYGHDFALIAVSPRQDFALTADSVSGVVSLAQADGTLMPLTGAAAHPDSMVLSPLGSAAVLWFSSSSHLQVVSGLPGSPSVREFDATFLSLPERGSLSSALPATLAVSDDGQWAAGAWPRGLYAFGPNGEVSRLPLGERAMALAFFAGRQDLALATDLHVFSLADIGGRAAVSTLYDSTLASEAPLDPAGIALSPDNLRLALADRSGRLLTLDLNTASAAHLDCGCAPEGVFSMGRTVFRLTGLSAGSFRLLDASTGDVYFVPLALPLAAPQEGQP